MPFVFSSSVSLAFSVRFLCGRLSWPPADFWAYVKRSNRHTSNVQTGRNGVEFQTSDTGVSASPASTKLPAQREFGRRAVTASHCQSCTHTKKSWVVDAGRCVEKFQFSAVVGGWNRF